MPRNEMILSGWDYIEIYRTLKGKYPDEKIPSYSSIRNHALKHVEEYTERAAQHNEKMQEIIRQKIHSSADTVDQLLQNLEMSSKSLSSLWEEWSITGNVKLLSEISSMMRLSNSTINLLLKYSEQIEEKEMTEEQVFKKLIMCMRDFPPEYIKKFRERWLEDNPK